MKGAAADEVRALLPVMHIVSPSRARFVRLTGSTHCGRASRPARHRRAEDPGDGDHRRAGDRSARRLQRRDRLRRLRRRHGYLYRFADDGGSRCDASLQAGGGIVADSTPVGDTRRLPQNAALVARSTGPRTTSATRPPAVPREVRMIFMLDNYDAFTWTLYQRLRRSARRSRSSATMW